tara:strand:+ start:118 stop:726 length:609 start_codon:yes stop_codon:yes gene_type:complete
MNLEYIRNLSRLEIEVWKDLPNFKNIYKVSNLGRVKSLNYKRTGKSRILKTLLNKPKGRLRTVLWVNNKGKAFYIHQLVAMTFLNHKPCGHKIVVDHIDNNRLNNNLYNLQLVTHRENCSKDRKSKYSKYTGVTYCKTKKFYYARIYIDNHIHLGTFRKEIDAANAYKKALKEYEAKEIHYNTKNKKIREYSKPNLYECRGN